MIKYKKGNLLEAEENIIAHGCNCSGGFGSGVAGQIAKTYPIARTMYLSTYNNGGWVLGAVQLVPVGLDKWIANCGTQQAYLPRGICHADYPGIKTAMISLKEYAKIFNSSIAIPKIGCGLAGGDWNIVSKILEEVFKDYDVTVYEL